MTTKTLNWNDPMDLREALAELHVAEFISAYQRRRARQIARCLSRLTGISETEIYANACEDADYIRNSLDD
jgi:hypothetical protein